MREYILAKNGLNFICTRAENVFRDTASSSGTIIGLLETIAGVGRVALVDISTDKLPLYSKSIIIIGEVG